MSTSFDIRSLLQFSRLLNRSENLDRIYDAFLLSLMGKLKVTRGGIAISPTEDGRFIIEHTRGRTRELTGESFLPSPDLLPPDSDGRFLRIRPDTFVESDFDPIHNGLHWMVPIRFSGRTYGIVLLGHPFIGDAFTQGEVDYALVLAAITAITVEGWLMKSALYDTNRRLARRVSRLHSVFEAGRAFGGQMDTGRIIRNLGYTLMGEMTLMKYALYLRRGAGYHIAVNRFEKEVNEHDLNELQKGEGIILAGERWERLRESGIRGAIPLRSQGESEGVLLVGERLQYDIDEEDLEFLEALGTMAIGALENVRLLGEMIEKRRLEEDLRIAWEIQQGLLPSHLPGIPGYSIAARTIPAREVGGDCYDVLTLPDGRVMMSIADVSGKGTPASLLMASFQAALRALAPLDLELSELAGRINDLVNDNTAPDKFITAFLARLDPATNRMEYVNAGHNPPLHFSPVTGEVGHLVEGGIIFGIMPTDRSYETGMLELKEGELVLFYTDGVTESMNVNQIAYGDEELIRFLCDQADQEPETIIAELLRRLQDHAGEAPRSDDITMIALKQTP